MFTWLTARVRAWAGRARAEHELDEELRDHVERETQANLERGLAPEEARRAALRDLGGFDQTREAVLDERARPADWLLRDLEHAARALKRTPGFTATVIATLAIGIGGTTLVFSVVEALVIRALPYADPDHLVVVGPPVDWSVYERLRADSASFAELAAYVERGANVTVDGQSSRLGIAAVDRTFLDVVGVRPLIGRTFSNGLLAEQGEQVVLLSDRFWRARFASAPDVVGRTVTIDRVAHTVVGVLPPDFRTIAELAPNPDSAIDLTVSLLVPVVASETWNGMRGLRGSDSYARLTVVGRLRPGVTLSSASREVDGRFRNAILSTFVPSGTYSVRPASRAVAGDLSNELTILSVAVALLFLVACANLTNLQLARLEARRREFAIRLALGAGRARLVSTALAETLLTGLVGGAAGLLVAWAGVEVVRAYASPGLARLATLQLNGTVLTFAAVGTAAAALLTGIVPAWRIWRGDPVDSMQPGLKRTALRRGAVLPQLVIWQVALGVVLVFVGSLLSRDVGRRLAFDPGFRTEGILSAEVAPDRERYSRDTKPSPQTPHTRYCSRLLDGASRIPGVRAAALTGVVPGTETYTSAAMQCEGRTLGPATSIVSADYFSVLSIPIVAGRGFTAADGGETGLVLVVNQTFAQQLWGREQGALGKSVTLGVRPGGRPWTIVGVAADARDEGLWRPVRPKAYFLFTQFQEDGPVTVLLRSTAGDATALARPLAALIGSLDRDQPGHRVMSLQAFVAAKLSRERQIAAMLMTFALFTLALAAVGVHGILAYAVTLRTREFAIRRALGSEGRRIVALVVGRSAGLLTLGIGIAAPIALALRWYLANAVGTSTDRSPLLMATAVGLVAMTGLVASIASARRALRVQPTTVLRTE